MWSMNVFIKKLKQFSEKLTDNSWLFPMRDNLQLTSLFVWTFVQLKLDIFNYTYLYTYLIKVPYVT